MTSNKKIFCHHEQEEFDSSEFINLGGYYVHQRGKAHWAESGDFVKGDDPKDTASFGPKDGDYHE